jgi:hypothetical protein
MPNFGPHGVLRPSPRAMARAGAVLVGISLALVTTVAPASATPKKAPTKLSRAVAIASESRSQVVTLHDLSVSVGQANGMPEKVIHSSAQHLEVTFTTEATAARAIGAVASSPTGALASSLRSYESLAVQVVSATTKKNPSMTASFSKALAANDKKWLGALADLGKADHVNLLKEVPTLLYPKTKS